MSCADPSVMFGLGEPKPEDAALSSDFQLEPLSPGSVTRCDSFDRIGDSEASKQASCVCHNGVRAIGIAL